MPPSSASTTTPSIRRASVNDLGPSSREPKRQRATPSPQPRPSISRASSGVSVSSVASTRATEPRRATATSASYLHHRHGRLSVSHSDTSDWDDVAPPLHVQTSPPYHAPRAYNMQNSPPRGRGMSVPLTQLQKKLSNVSLGKTRPTTPILSETSPEAMTRTPTSSCPASVDTPPLTTTPPRRRLPRALLRHNTPAPLTTLYDQGYLSSGTPKPDNHTLLGLGSPFASKSALGDTDLASPTFPPPHHHQTHWEETDAVPDLQPSGSLSRRTCTNADDTGSCTSASSVFSSERHGQQTTRPSVVNVWSASSISDEDDDVSVHVKRTTFYGGSARSADQFWQPTRLFQSSPGATSPFLAKSFAPSPISSRPLSPLFPLPLSRVESASSTAALENEPTKGFERCDASKLLIPSVESLGRRTSDPAYPSDPSTFSFALMSATRDTQSEITHRHISSSPSSSDANEAELTPSRSSRHATSALPPRPAHHLTRQRSEMFTFPGPAESVPNSTPPKRSDPFVPTRPKMPKRATLPEMPTARGTPLGRLHHFGDDKPSPAAFESSGIAKKRGEKNKPRSSLPVATHTTPQWSPMPKAAPRTAQRPARSFLANSSSASGLPSRRGVCGDGDSDMREELSQEFDLEDTDQDDMSPLRPMRSSFRHSIGSRHHRVSSTASEAMTSPISRRTRGHTRMSSTASSIGGSRGLRRKGSSLFGSGASDSEMPSPATPTKNTPIALIQPRFGITTPSPTPASTRYPFVRRLSMASVTSVDISPTASPLLSGRVRTLSATGPVARASNPMLAATFRAHAHMPATPAWELHIGDTYIPKEAREAGAGRYERDFVTVQALGQGEFSSVWKVRCKADDSMWAVKKGKPYSGFRDRQRQLEEVAILRAIGKAEHPNILRLVDSWEEAGRLHIRTELALCGDLANFLLSVSEFGGLEEGRVWKMLAELSSALQHIHSQGVLHLDFKPSNILITTEGSLKVADFGLSVFVIGPETSGDLGNGDLSIVSSGSDRSLGPSPASDHEGDREYLCPEALNDVPPAPPADIYSLGIMTLEAALSVELPSNGEAWIKLRHDDFSDLDNQYALRGGPKPDVIPGEPPTPVVSMALVSTIQHMMASNPAQRMTLAELLSLVPLRRAQEAMARGREEGGLLRGRIAGPALAEEDDEWTAYVLGEVA
ncbi:hypothetical protein CC85DRAFT_276975 [Cutaneotrichosporon oleaginosum]|uniref:Protein kinase domain-containing protein n=1 Tax=Cutaneotrichosporon oleaginosum TaxID=879819 RepID=A0A0J0XIS3_9TREE|nr:uncharacterized protein CC85DRAFT_276975 [Cutaneotrichosporon oleaginosum]KLT40952.1 hypothetical protein CC85DRAFT_276975 [Cutaneotrichosporon oleaginosum]TXT15444.1 hypothetical protein COLE_01637 [Cutaneotrichosporon oleaginosum]